VKDTNLRLRMIIDPDTDFMRLKLFQRQYTGVRIVSGNGEYCIVVGWDAEATAMRFRGFRGRARRPESRGCTVRCCVVGRSILNSVAL